MPPQLCVLRVLQQVLPQHQQIQSPSHQVIALQTSPQALPVSQHEQRLTHQWLVLFATLAPTCATATPTGANLVANAAPVATVTTTVASSKSPSVDGYTAGTLGAMMHNCVTWGFTGQQALKQAQEWQTVLELAQP